MQFKKLLDPNLGFHKKLEPVNLKPCVTYTHIHTLHAHVQAYIKTYIRKHMYTVQTHTHIP